MNLLLPRSLFKKSKRVVKVVAVVKAVYRNWCQTKGTTKSWKDKIKVWFAKTYWRPEDCIEDKNPKDFNKIFNPEIGSDIKLFSFFQMIFTTIVSGAVLTYASLHSYNEIVLFGVSLLILATLTGYLMQGNKSSGYQLIMLSSVFGIFSIYYFNLINIELLSTKLLIAQLSINILIVTSVYFLQSLSNIKILKTK